LSSKVTDFPVVNPETVPPIVKLAACAYDAEARTTKHANTAVNTFIPSMRIDPPDDVTAPHRRAVATALSSRQMESDVRGRLFSVDFRGNE
jgi:hypothetical protein